MKYFVRMKGRPPFHGPYDEPEIASRLRSGELAGPIEVVEATGQTERQLAAATDWRVWSETPDDSSEARSPAAKKQHYLQEVRATTCYPLLRKVLAVVTGFAIVIEAAATILTLSAAASVGHGVDIPNEFVAPVVIAIAICTLELLTTIAFYGLLRTLVDLADLSLHRDAGAAAS